MTEMICPHIKNCDEYIKYNGKNQSSIIVRKEHYGCALENERYSCFALDINNSSRDIQTGCSHLEQLNLLNRLEFQKV